MRNFKVKMAYDGSCYHGFQRQDNAITVQQKVEEALFELLHENITIDGCSRTDTGVHAREFYFSFQSESPITLRGIVFGLNPKLPPDISILSAEEAPMDFHARFDSKGKEYEYIVHNSEIKNPFYKNTALKYWYPIDERKLDLAAKDFIGEHDFKSFCSTACDKQITVRTIYDARVIREGDLVKFYFSGSGFLYNMVRIMVGTLLFINEGKIPENAIPDIISAKDRTKAGKTVAPQGLYLNRVFY
ncbi:MAG: tRNA pseudouridine(38-40) synthase TruA [Ruminococcus sp.]|nr:tRNA pseudouridine(38-40) synthase TruA [Ruminococcus sp.]MCD7728186.1 tRNA pseudouridine(38-40) synthase TruA [Ruminococcus sp.]